MAFSLGHLIVIIHAVKNTCSLFAKSIVGGTMRREKNKNKTLRQRGEGPEVHSSRIHANNLYVTERTIWDLIRQDSANLYECASVEFVD